MHIEPGVVTGAKLALGYATGAGSIVIAGKLAFDAIRNNGVAEFAGRALVATGMVFSFFQILPHMPVGVSEVHLILGSTLLLTLGAGPAAVGLVLGLLAQGLFFVPADLPQYGMNVSTLIGSLAALALVARRVIPSHTAYVDLSYGQVMRMSLAFQAVTVSWVAFWVLWGQGVSLATLGHIATFGTVYLSVVLIEPLIDLAVLAMAKRLRNSAARSWFVSRMFEPAVA
ncbi:MAG: energy-coupling factor ABC transporter permease [Rhodobacterales bacterium]